jgi:hypothetical protein
LFEKAARLATQTVRRARRHAFRKATGSASSRDLLSDPGRLVRPVKQFGS